jgi:hypothetical protein
MREFLNVAGRYFDFDGTSFGLIALLAGSLLSFVVFLNIKSCTIRSQ